jgi:hypothetical protein
MPAHQQLCAAIGAGDAGLAFTQERMPGQIHSLVIAQGTLAPHVIAIH